MSESKKELLLWIGPLLEERELEEMVANGECATASANLAEWNFLKYFVRETDTRIVALSAIRTIEWPKNKVLRYRRRPAENYLDGRLTLHNVGFCNIFGVSHISRSNSLALKARELAAVINEDVFVNIFVYSMHLPFMKAASVFKAHHRNSSYKLIVPDLPLNMNTSTPLRKILKQVDWKNIQARMGDVDGYILYTKQMAEYLQLPKDRYMVCEGIANIDLLELPIPEIDWEQEGKRLIYAGNLDAKYRIENLVKAFGMVDDPNMHLEIYGKGSGEDKVKAACSETRNAQYCGYKTNSEIIALMRKSTFVVNPRPVDLECAEYSCPSKTLEAMACGVVFASSNLPGIPQEYWDYIVCLDCSSVTRLAEELIKLARMNHADLRVMRERARCFIDRRSSSSIKKMLDYCSYKNA